MVKYLPIIKADENSNYGVKSLLNQLPAFLVRWMDGWMDR